MMSKRERILAIIVAAACTLFVLDGYVIGPLLGSLSAMNDRREQLQAELTAATRLIETHPRLEERWRHMIQAGLWDNPAEAEAQVFTSLREWSELAGLSLASVKPQTAPGDAELAEMRFVASCQGSMRAVARFLWLAESATSPVRIEKLQLASKQEGADDLTLTLHLSTVYRASRDDRRDAISRGGL